MATATDPGLSMTAKAIRKRANREALRQIKQEQAVTRRTVVRPSVVRSELTERERGLLRDQTDRMFASGEIDIRFMGVRFLELHAQGWTPPFLSRDPAIADMEEEDRAEWTDEMFEAVFEWWSKIHPTHRDDLVGIMRDMAVT